jgi:hypothetical protein
MGFPTAGWKWFAHDLYEPMADLLASRAVRERGIYNVQAIAKDLERHKRGEADLHSGLFHVAELEMLAELLESDSLRGSAGSNKTRLPDFYQSQTQSPKHAIDNILVRPPVRKL